MSACITAFLQHTRQNELMLHLSQYMRSRPVNKLLRATGHLISFLPFKPIERNVLQILWASLSVKDKLCLILSQVQGHSAPGGCYTQANMCRYKDKTLSDSIWVLWNTAWPTPLRQCRAAGKACGDSVSVRTVQKARDMKYLEKSSVFHLLSLTHSFESRQKGCEPIVCCYTERLSMLWGCCVGFLPWVNSILYFYTLFQCSIS